MPPAMPNLSAFGIPSKIQARAGLIDSATVRTDEQKIAPSAVSHERPMPLTMPNAKKALSPMPGASAIG